MRWFVVDGSLVRGDRLVPAELMGIRKLADEGKLLCPTCREPLELFITTNGPTAKHKGDHPFHETDDQTMLIAKQKLTKHLRTLCPADGARQSWQVSYNMPLQEQGVVADVLAISDHGAKLAIEYQNDDLSGKEIEIRIKAFAEASITLVWILDSRRLRLTGKDEIIKMAVLETLETDLLRRDLPLIYLDKKGLLTQLVPTNDVIELAKLGDPRIGRAPCALRHYPLQQLRLRNGEWWLDRSYDPPLPKPPSLPDNLFRRLENLRRKI